MNGNGRDADVGPKPQRLIDPTTIKPDEIVDGDVVQYIIGAYLCWENGKLACYLYKHVHPQHCENWRATQGMIKENVQEIIDALFPHLGAVVGSIEP